MNISPLSLHRGMSNVAFRGTTKEQQKTDKEKSSVPSVTQDKKIPKSSLVMLATLLLSAFAPIQSALRASDPASDFPLVAEDVDNTAQSSTKKELIAKENQAARVLIQQLFKNTYEPFIDEVYKSEGLFNIPLYEEDCKSDIERFYTEKENSERFLNNILNLGDKTPRWDDEEIFGYYAKNIITLVKNIEKEQFKNESVWQPIKQKLDENFKKAKPFLDAYKTILEFAIKKNKGQSGAWEETLYPAMEAVGFKVNTSDF